MPCGSFFFIFYFFLIFFFLLYSQLFFDCLYGLLKCFCNNLDPDEDRLNFGLAFCLLLWFADIHFGPRSGPT